MNIFYLDENPKLAAQYHTDKHVVKMLLESAQLLCTAVREVVGTPYKIVYPNGKVKVVNLLPDETYSFKEIRELVPEVDDEGFDIPGEFVEIVKHELILSSGLYNSTHVNHPCSTWVRESYSNWMYVYNLFFELQTEWQLRWKHNKIHKSVFALSISDYPLNASALASLCLPHEGFTPPALAMPEHCKIPGNPVESYRKYYREEKIHLHKWTSREVPYWL